MQLVEKVAGLVVKLAVVGALVMFSLSVRDVIAGRAVANQLAVQLNTYDTQVKKMIGELKDLKNEGVDKVIGHYVQPAK